jgi:basic membrane protein A and related proteins
MKKKLFLILGLIVLASLMFSACKPIASATPAATEAATTAPVKKVLLITEDPIGINPYFITAQDGLNKAAQELGVETKVIECNGDPTNMDENLRAAAREDYDLIIAMTFGFNDTLLEIAPTTPDKFYVCIDCGLDLTGITNVRDLGFKSYEAAYLLGVAGGLLTKTNTVGSIGPVEMPFMTRWTIPFGDAALKTNPNATVLDTLWVGDWADPATAKELAITMANQGADVINGAAAAGNPGIFEAAQELNFLTTGVDVNECPKAPDHVIDSTVKRVDLAIYNSIDSFLKGELTGGAVDFGLKEGGVDLAVFAWPGTDTQCVLAQHPDVMAQVSTVRDQIISGALVIPDPMMNP